MTFSACGDDTNDESASDPAPDGGAATKQDAGAGKSGSGGAGGNVASTNPSTATQAKCGSKMCSAGGGFAMPCCADEATETCGMSFMGAGCSIPEPGDERCPSVNGFAMLPSCCTEDNMCGINAAMFGMPGCVELGMAAARAQMTAASAFPKPRTCDGKEVSNVDADAGADADGGM